MPAPRLPLILTAAALVVTVVLLRFGGSLAAFGGVTANPNNAFSAGSVTVQDNDGGAALFDTSTLKAGDTTSRCIKVTYTGSLPARLRLHGTTTGTGLDPYLSLTVTRGTFTAEPGAGSCSTFTPDATTYVTGQPAGVVYGGTLQNFPDDWNGGLVDPTAASPESWTSGESHVYRLQVTLGDTTTGRGKQAGQVFVWEAQNA